MGRAGDIFDGTINPETLMRPRIAAKLAFPCGTVARDDIERAICRREIGYYHVGHRVFVTIADVNDWHLNRTGREGGVLGIVGTIYVAGFGPYVKIGFTKNVAAIRLRALQTAAPEKLVRYASFLGTTAQEARLHARFQHFRLNGEWFRKEAEVAAWIEAGCPL